MPRKSTGPRYYRSKRAWYATVNGETKKLVEGAKEATRKTANDLYEQFRGAAMPALLGDRSEVGVVLQSYLRDARDRIVPPPLSPNSYKIQLRHLEAFCRWNENGHVAVRDIGVKHVYSWLEGQIRGVYHQTRKKTYHWNQNNCAAAYRTLFTALNWAVRQKIISFNPLVKHQVRGPELLYKIERLTITDQEHAYLLAFFDRRKNKSMAHLLRLLWVTGARPSEIVGLTAAEWDSTQHCFKIDPERPESVGRLKTRRHLRKAGRKRVVHIPDVAVGIVESLLARAAGGPLFISERGMACLEKSMQQRLAIAIAKSGGKVRVGVSLYSYRHRFVTEWLRQGGDTNVLCELLNTSPTMLRRHYSHLFEDHATLQKAVNNFASQLDSGDVAK